jgi:hypothetical protein
VTSLREFDRIEVERLRRARRSNEADRLTERELSQRVAQLGARRPARAAGRALRAVAFAAAATSLTLGALAASGALSVHTFFGEAALGDEPPSKAERAPRANGRSALQKPALTQELPDAPPVAEAPPVPSASPHEVEPPAKVVAPGTPRGQRALEVGGAEAATDSAGRAWTRAAEALRRGDNSAAEQAFGELSSSADPSTRDAALLAQAELDLGSGSSSRALVVLGWLAERGATPYVRTRARQILAEKK